MLLKTTLALAATTLVGVVAPAAAQTRTTAFEDSAPITESEDESSSGELAQYYWGGPWGGGHHWRGHHWRGHHWRGHPWGGPWWGGHHWRGHPWGGPWGGYHR